MLLMAGAAVVRGLDEEKGSEFHHSLPFFNERESVKMVSEKKKLSASHFQRRQIDRLDRGRRKKRFNSWEIGSFFPKKKYNERCG